MNVHKKEVTTYSRAQLQQDVSRALAWREVDVQQKDKDVGLFENLIIVHSVSQ